MKIQHATSALALGHALAAGLLLLLDVILAARAAAVETVALTGSHTGTVPRSRIGTDTWH
jgi:hypothetical protein